MDLTPLSDSEVERVASAIAPTVFDAPCPRCFAPAKTRCREQAGAEEFREVEQPHNERIRQAVVRFITACLDKGE